MYLKFISMLEWFNDINNSAMSMLRTGNSFFYNKNNIEVVQTQWHRQRREFKKKNILYKHVPLDN